MDFDTLLQIAKTQFSYFLHELSRFQLGQRFLLIFFYAVLAKAADLFIDRLLIRIAARTHWQADERIMEIVHRPICWSIFLLGIMHAVLLEPAFDAPWNIVLPNIVKTLILMVWWFSLIREITAMDEHNMEWALSKIDKTHFYMIKNISRIVLLFTGILWGLVIWNVNLTPLFASAGIIGIAIALAAKDTLANFFGGIALFIDAAYKVGDYIILDTGERGEVVEVGIRSTKIKTRDDILITIPNSIMSTTKIINQSAPEPRYRIRLDVGVGYDSDLRLVEKTLLAVAKQNNALADKPLPRVRVRSFGDSAIHFQLLVWVQDPRHRGRETHNLLKMIHSAFQERGIEIPFPKRDVNLTERVKKYPADDDSADYDTL
ncbi:MAG TPA: mechanosensitive ion channel family protein [Desulfobulbaceae bacterium]|nr:mechanosensitive ion channel family protein [Desulfobulbaceae bacterium]